MEKIIQFQNRIISLVQSCAGALTSWLPITVLIGICPGLTLWFAIHQKYIIQLAKNEIDSQARTSLLIFVLISIAVTVILYGVGYKYLKSKKIETTVVQFFKRINGFASVLLILPVFIFLQSKGFSKNHPFITLFSCLGVGVLICIVVYRILHVITLPKMTQSKAKWIFPAIVGVSICAYSIIISRFHIIHHNNLGTHIYDLGVYVNTLWHSVRGDFLDCSFIRSGTHISAHFDPILIPVSLILLIAEQVETVLIFQTVWLALGAIPLYLQTQKITQNAYTSLCMCGVYLLCPALHGFNMFDFHSLVLAGPIILWVLYFLESGRKTAYFLAFLLLLTAREDMSLLSCFIGMYAIISKKSPRLGVLTIVVSLIYFGIVQGIVMDKSTNYSNYFSDIQLEEESIYSSIIKTILTNPMFALKQAFGEPKIIYLLQLLVPMLFLPLFSGKSRILFVYGFTFILLASKSAVYQISFQYSTLILPMLLASLPIAIMNVSKHKLVAALNIDPNKLRLALSTGMLAATLFTSIFYGVFWPNPSFKAGYRYFQRVPSKAQLARYESIQEIKKMIPENKIIVCSETIGPHFALRDKTRQFRTTIHGDYVVVRKYNMKRKEKRLKQWKKVRDSKKYKLIYDKNDIALYKRK